MLTIRAHNGWSTFHVNQNQNSRHTKENKMSSKKSILHAFHLAFHLPPAWSLHHQKCNNKKAKIPSLQQHSINHYYLILIQCESRIALWLITSITSTTASISPATSPCQYHIFCSLDPISILKSTQLTRLIPSLWFKQRSRPYHND